MPDVSGVGLDGWLELRSSEFVLYSSGSKEGLERFALDLARFVAVVEATVRSVNPRGSARFYLVDGGAVNVFVPDPNTGGYIVNSLNGFDSLVRGTAHSPYQRYVLQHEFTHYLTFRGSKLQPPMWYSEGFAEFLATTRKRSDTMEIGSPSILRLKELETRRADRKPIDLARIFSFVRRGVGYYPRDFYAISWATVHYLNADPDRRRRLRIMVDLQAQGTAWSDAYALGFDIPLAELSRQVELHGERSSRGAPMGITYLPLDALAVKTDWVVREMPAREVPVELGELALRHCGAGSAECRIAEAFFVRALEMDPTSARGRGGLALALAEQGRFDDVVVPLAAFRLSPNPTPRALANAGRAEWLRALSLSVETWAGERSALLEESLSLFRRALEIAPEDPVVLAGLGRSQMSLGALPEARRTLAMAQELGEWDARLTIDRGHVELRSGDSGGARRLWNEVLRRGSAAEAAEAKGLIQSIPAPRSPTP